MKRLKALAVSIVLSLIISFTFLNFYINKEKKTFDLFSVKNNSIRYSDITEKYKSHDVLTKNIGKGTITLFGSSELIVTNDWKEHPFRVLDYSDLNIMQIGEGFYQSIIHAITLGSIGEDSPITTVNLILSMQWFEGIGMKPEAFQPRFSVDHLYNLYRSEKVSQETKTKIYNRILELSKSNGVVTRIVEGIKRNTRFDQFVNNIMYKKYKLIANSKFMKHYKVDYSVNEKKAPEKIDWDALRKEAISECDVDSSSNEFFMFNKYFDKNFKMKLAKLKDSAKNTKYRSEEEYGDLQLFLDVAKDLGLKVNLILVPLQGYWADYTGVPKEEIEYYYSRIREISDKNNVNLIDYSKYSYTKYFFRDATHLGRLGLLQLQEDLIKYND